MKALAQLVLAISTSLLPCSLAAAGRVKEGDQNKPKVLVVGGQVTRPGAMAYKRTTIFSVIVAAGGPTQFGTLKRVKLFRNGKERLLDLTDDKLKNAEFAEPGDIIEVPQRNLFGR